MPLKQIEDYGVLSFMEFFWKTLMGLKGNDQLYKQLTAFKEVKGFKSFEFNGVMLKTFEVLTRVVGDFWSLILHV